MEFEKIIQNNVLITAIISWAIAQSIKIFTSSYNAKKIDFKRIIGSGGMPSSHSSFVMALSIKTGRINGFDSPLFAVALAFSFIVMYDAAGVRRAAGMQARVLNKILEDINRKQGIRYDRLKELIGHTPVEVIAGAVLGILVGIIV